METYKAVGNRIISNFERMKREDGHNVELEMEIPMDMVMDYIGTTESINKVVAYIKNQGYTVV